MGKKDTLRSELRSLWLENFPEYYWGDDFDVRYYLCDRLQEFRGKRILDVGCNVGVCAYVASQKELGNEVYGIDLNEDALSKAKDLAQGRDVTYAHGSWFSLPWEDGFFDALVMANVIECVGSELEIKDMLSEAKRVLRNDGVLLLTTPNGNNVFYAGAQKLSWEKLSSCLEEAGFSYQILRWNPFPLLSRLIPKKLQPKIPYAVKRIFFGAPYKLLGGCFGERFYRFMKKLAFSRFSNITEPRAFFAIASRHKENARF